jgi:hypothetical protein
LRNRKLSAETIDRLFTRLAGQIKSEPDPGGFRQPFAALLLSEVARTDRFDPTLTVRRREELVTLAADYLTAVRDYRGFSATEGWRHSVAHGSDLVLQLVLDPNIGAPQIRRLMAAVASQVAPAGVTFYHFGEPERLARAVFHAWRRGVVEDADWAEWFDAISDARPFASWQAVFSSQPGLAKRHNTLAFLLAMHFYATNTAEPQDGALDKLVMQAITRVMNG